MHIALRVVYYVRADRNYEESHITIFERSCGVSDMST
jgi:hypothetical protein